MARGFARVLLGREGRHDRFSCRPRASKRLTRSAGSKATDSAWIRPSRRATRRQRRRVRLFSRPMNIRTARSRVRISGENGSVKDNCYLQLYNKGGVSWNEGMPKDPPPAAEGMSLVFADDFNGPLSISSTRSERHVLRPQAAGRLARFQRPCVFRRMNRPRTRLRSRFLSADQGQRQAAQLGLDLLAEERRQRVHRQRALLLRMPVHRPQRDRHLAGLLAHDRLHDGLQSQGQQNAVRRAGHHRSLRRRRPARAKRRSTPT